MSPHEVAECAGCGYWFFPYELQASGVCDDCARAARAAVRAQERRSRPERTDTA